jgi:Domain of unknown function (DUF4340)
MKKSLLYILALMALAAITYFVLQHKEVPMANADFSIADTSDISKIFLADMPGNTITLKRDAKGWSLNDSMRANDIRVWNVVDVMMNAKPVQPVPNSMTGMVVKGLSSGGVKVEIYNNKNRKIRSLIMGGTVQSGIGNYAKVEGLEDAYIYRIPNFDSDLLPNFDTDIEKWRTKRVITKNEADLKSVTLYYDLAKDSSFTILKENNAFKIKTSKQQFDGDDKKCKIYFKLFKAINCVGFINDIKDKDSIYKSGLQYGYVVLTDQNDQQDSLQLVHFQADQRVKSWKEINGKYFDMEYLYGKNKAGNFILNLNNFAPVLSTPSYLAK